MLTELYSFLASARGPLSAESDATKKAYGDTDFGRGCMVARRLGLNPDRTEMSPVGRPISVTDGGAPIRAVMT